MDNAQKIPFARSLPLFAQRKALEEIQKRGTALPGHVISVSGSIVTVAFDVEGATIPQVTMPVFGPEYIRYPVQANDKGVAFPASTYLGGVTGLGIGTADLTPQMNLTSLVWFPLGNKTWATPPGSDANTLTLYGHAATLLLDSFSGNGSVKLTSTGITLTMGSSSITINSSGVTLTYGSNSLVVSSSGVTIQGKPFLTHQHTGVTTGSGDSGGVL